MRLLPAIWAVTVASVCTQSFGLSRGLRNALACVGQFIQAPPPPLTLRSFPGTDLNPTTFPLVAKIMGGGLAQAYPASFLAHDIQHSLPDTPERAHLIRTLLTMTPTSKVQQDGLETLGGPIQLDPIIRSMLPYYHHLYQHGHLHFIKAVEPTAFESPIRGAYFYVPFNKDGYHIRSISSRYRGQSRRLEPTTVSPSDHYVLFAPFLSDIHEVGQASVLLHEIDHAIMTEFFRDWMAAGRHLAALGEKPDPLWRTYVKIKGQHTILDSGFNYLMMESRAYQLSYRLAVRWGRGSDLMDHRHPIARYIGGKLVEKGSWRVLHGHGLPTSQIAWDWDTRAKEMVLQAGDPQAGHLPTMLQTLDRARVKGYMSLIERTPESRP